MRRADPLHPFGSAIVGILLASVVVLGSDASPARAEELDPDASVSETVGRCSTSLPRNDSNTNDIAVLKESIASHEALSSDVREPQEYRQRNLRGAKNRV